MGLLIFYVTNVEYVTCYANESLPFRGPRKSLILGWVLGDLEGLLFSPLRGRQKGSRRQRGAYYLVSVGESKEQGKEDMSGLHMRDGFNIKDRVPMGYSVFAICNEVY